MKKLPILLVFLPLLAMLPSGLDSKGGSFVSLAPILLFCSSVVMLLRPLVQKPILARDTLGQWGMFLVLAVCSSVVGLYISLFFLDPAPDLRSVIVSWAMTIFGPGMQAVLTMGAIRMTFGISFNKLGYFFIFFLAGVSHLLETFILLTPNAGEGGLLRFQSMFWYPGLCFALVFEAQQALVHGEIPKQLVEVDSRVRCRRLGWACVGVWGGGIAAILALLVLMFVSYDGYCYGFTDGKWPCSLVESLANQLFFSLMFLSPLAIVWLVVAGILSGKYLRAVAACRRSSLKEEA